MNPPSDSPVAGAALVDFSPLHDKKLPKGVCGLYLGGGYPELHAEALAMNHAMRESVRAAVAAGMPTVAECGGFLYLQRTLQDQGGTLGSWPRPWTPRASPPASSPGSAISPCGPRPTASSLRPGRRCPPMSSTIGTPPTGPQLRGQKPLSQRHWETGVATPSLYAGFPHFHFASKPQAAVRFLAAARRWREAQKEMQQK